MPRRSVAAVPRQGRAERAPPRPQDMAKKQRDISVSEFFAKNRHLLGFDNPSKALLTTVKEGVDNALDACEEAGIAAGRARRDPPARRDALPRRDRGQRPRHREGAGAEGVRAAALRLEVPSPAPEPRPAGHRHQRRRHVRPAHHRQAHPHRLAHRRQEARAPVRAGDRHQDQRAGGEARRRVRLGSASRHARRDRARGRLARRPAFDRRLHPPDLARQPARAARVPAARPRARRTA